MSLKLTLYVNMVYMAYVMLDIFVKSKMTLTSIYQYLYTNFSVVSYPIDIATRVGRYVYTSWLGIYTEPHAPTWFNVSYMKSSSDETPSYDMLPKLFIQTWTRPQRAWINQPVKLGEVYQDDSFTFPDNCRDYDVVVKTVPAVWKNMLVSERLLETCTKPLFTYKHSDDIYCFRVSCHLPSEVPGENFNKITKNTGDFASSAFTQHAVADAVLDTIGIVPPLFTLDYPFKQFIPSRVRFLSIEYSHPKMNYTVPLELPKCYFVAGNHILSSTFVLRMLAYTVGNAGYVFDDDYVLKIMDKNIRYFELKSDQFIELDPMLYIIRNVNSSKEKEN